MAGDKKKPEPGIGLALSGGGYRATLFHLGALWRLNELGQLARLNRISSVSGGSITAGYLGVKWSALKFDGAPRVAANFVPLIVDPLRQLCTRTIDVPTALKGLFLPWKSAGQYLEGAYRKYLLGDADLQSLPDEPRFVFNSTNFKTGVDFRFSKPYAGDYRIGLIDNPRFRVSLAVAASSAFPPVLSPLEFNTDPAAFKEVPGADLYDQVAYRKRQVLTDGGVYDNLGLETVEKRYQTLLVSDAGAPFDPVRRFGAFWPAQALRVVGTIMNQALALRKRTLITRYKLGERLGAYWGIDTEITEYKLPDSLPCPPAKREELASIRTRLDRFSEQEQCELINWGYAVSDAALRRYLLPPGTPPPAGWPYPKYALNGRS